MISPPRRVPPPPTRFAPTASQPKPPDGPPRRVFAPPPIHPSPGVALRKPAAVVQRALIKTAQPMKQRPVVKCTMGQGVTGTLDRVVLYSMGFSSCTPVVMFNDKSLRGGLFHFSAERLDLQKKALGQMHDALVPSVIYIGDRSIKQMSGIKALDQPINDVDDIRDFLVNEWMAFCDIKTLELRAAQYYVTLDANGNLFITADWPSASDVDIDFTYTNKPEIPSQVSAVTTDVLVYGKNLYPDKKPV